MVLDACDVVRLQIYHINSKSLLPLGKQAVAENIVRKQVLRNQSLQELYEIRMAFVEIYTKARWLSLKALRKQDGFR